MWKRQKSAWENTKQWQLQDILNAGPTLSGTQVLTALKQVLQSRLRRMLMVTLNSVEISVSSLLHHVRKALFKFVLYLKASRRKGLAPLRQKHPFLCQKAHCKTEGLNQKGLLWKLNIDRERRLIGLRYLVAKEAFSWLGGNSPGCSAASCEPSMLCFLSCFLSWKRKEQKAILGMKSCVKQMAALS